MSATLVVPSCLGAEWGPTQWCSLGKHDKCAHRVGGPQERGVWMPECYVTVPASPAWRRRAARPVRGVVVTAPPMAYYGGKTRLAAKIAGLLPAHEHYVEPYAGSLAVLLAKKPSRMETVNDLDDLLMTFWRVLRDKPAELARVCALTPHSRTEYLEARYTDLADLDDVEVARLVWLQITQGRGGTLRSTGWRTYVDPAGSNTSMPGYLDAYVERMAVAAERLHAVSLECRPALEVIEQFGRITKCCLYVDPPYLGETRSHGGNGYRVEMRNGSDHENLLDALRSCTSELYDEALTGWTKLVIPTTTGQGKTHKSRTEVIWSNRAINAQHAFDFGSAS